MSRPGSSWRRGRVAALCLVLGFPAASHAADLYQHGSWSALASDRLADRVGDSLTVVIDQNSLATNSTQNGSKKNNHVGGQLSAGTSFNKSGALDLSSSFDGAGQTGRVDKIVAQISVVVDQVLPNGDLHVVGAQSLKINGERTNIQIRGRVRRADIGSDNSVASTRLADAAIDYDGAGFVTNGSRAGILTRLLNRIGLP